MAYACNGPGCMKTAKLASVGIAPHTDSHSGKMQGRQQDKTGTSAEDGQSVCDGMTDGLEELKVMKQFGLRC